MREDRTTVVCWIGIGLLAALLALATSSALAGSTSSDRSSARDHSLLSESSAGSLKRAVRAWHRDNYEMAIRHADIALGHALQGDDLELALAISCVLRGELGDLETGLVHCDRLVELTGGRDGRYLNGRANARMRSGDVENAIADYRAALALASGDPSLSVAWADAVQRDLARAMREQAPATETALASATLR